MNFDNLLVTREEAVAVVTLNRPQRRNALSLALMLELIACLDEIGGDPRVRAVILAAAGKVFCSGHDLAEMTGRDLTEYRRIFDVCSQLMQKIQAIPQPVIAEVQGIATAAGCQLVAACDLAIASEDAAFATPGVKIGLFCTTPMVALTRAIGRKRALQMLLTGEMVPARTAAEWGLVNQVVPAAGLQAATRQLAAKVAEASRRGGFDRQTGLLHADRSGSAQGLRLRQRSHVAERPGPRRAGGHRSLPGEASALLEKSVSLICAIYLIPSA